VHVRTGSNGTPQLKITGQGQAASPRDTRSDTVDFANYDDTAPTTVFAQSYSLFRDAYGLSIQRNMTGTTISRTFMVCLQLG
jgi:hypothetical protein